MQTIYLLVGAPGSGKSWVADQVKHKFIYLPHDKHPDNYLEHIKLNVSLTYFSGADLLIETPFSVSEYTKPLTELGAKVVPVFILETPEVTAKRYLEREGKPIPKGHLTRIQTYTKRAKELKAFSGTSLEVLEHLKSSV